MSKSDIRFPIQIRRERKVWITFVLNISIVIFLFLIGVFIGLFISNKKLIEGEMLTRARSDFQNILYTRKWNAKHGGVFVFKKPGMMSNPYLENPDIVTNKGEVLTMKNPALMTREISEEASKTDDYHFHITSLNPLNPNNAPDAFEKSALKDFEKGVKEVYGKQTDENNNNFFRYMAPLLVEEPCMKCHEKQGYKIGDIRGGISVSFNINKIEKSISVNRVIVFILFIVTTITLLILIYFFIFKLNKKLTLALEKVEELAVTDPLTKVFNRRYLMERLEEELAKCHRHKRDISCLLIDVDHFKRVNDTYGHQSGDSVLFDIAKMIKESFRVSDIVARYGGEEFIVILPETDVNDAAFRAEKLRTLVDDNDFPVGNFNTIRMSLSIGVTGFKGDKIPEKNGMDILTRTADQAMYIAKEKGRNRIEVRH